MDQHALAKSDPPEDIQTHTDALLDNLKLLKHLYPNLLVDWDLLRWACIYHDLGKLNEKFRARINKEKRYPDEIPHGLLSLAFIDNKLLEAKGYDKKRIKLLYHAIAYHHDRKMPSQNNDIEEEFAGLKIPLEHFEYDKLPSKFCADEINQHYFSVNGRICEEDGEIFYQFIMLEGLLNRLDYAASAHIAVENPNDFLVEAMDKLMERWRQKNHAACWNELQNYMRDNADKNVIVIAQTGMGKTEGALLWLGNNKGFFTLPLKNAINAIYQRVIKNIVQDKIEERVGMLHSDTFINYLAQSEQKSKEESEDNFPVDIYFTRTKQLSLPLTICTLDQLFNFVFRYRGFEQKLATLSYAKVIIDEVQMYSPDLIAYLILGLHYITRLGGKFAIVTATLPTLFIDLLKEQKIQFAMPQPFTDNNIRHSVKVLDQEINAVDVAALSQKYQGKKILVICNTIKSAINMYHQLKTKITDKPIYLLHSHFTKSDRRVKEEQILQMGQKKHEESCIWIATQIVEASLDIDFDLLFTELSDLNGLFQRLGRCYRKRILDISYNCFVFTGGSKRCSGVGIFIDKEIHRLSKKAIMGIDGVLSEAQKVAMVKELYTRDKLPDYFARIRDNLHYVQSNPEYGLNKKEASERFRNIDNVSVIPRKVFEEHKTEIYDAMNQLKTDSTGMDRIKIRTLKAKARRMIADQTVDISTYLAKNIKKEIIKINDFEQILIAECDYNSQEGIIRPVLTPKAEVNDFSSHSF